MKANLISFVLFGSCATLVPGEDASGDVNQNSAEEAATQIDQTKWQLVWQDEFDSKELDDTKWTLCKRRTSNWNDTMSDDPRLLRIADGVLHLRGIVNDRKDKDPVPYLTSGITSHRKYSFQFGKVQIRARFKSAQGAWPALWMLVEDAPGKSTYGEIDLMEHLNFDDKVYQTVHSDYTRNSDNPGTPPKGGTTGIERDDWNTYGLEWDSNRITFSVNGNPTHNYPRMASKGKDQWPFNQPFYLILSMQIGGDWVNNSGPTNPAHYPAGMEIDWVRVYRERARSNK